MKPYPRTEDNVEAEQGVVSHNLDTLEAGVDTAVDTVVDTAMQSTKEAVHEWRTNAEQLTDQVFTRVTAFWQHQRPRIEAYVTAHPWLVLGSLFVVAYWLSAPQRSRPHSS